MAMTTPAFRPAIIASELEQELAEFLRFRHLFRNVYGFVLRADRLRALQEKAPAVLLRLVDEIRAFLTWLTGE